jgi:hypothetical protein
MLCRDHRYTISHLNTSQAAPATAMLYEFDTHLRTAAVRLNEPTLRQAKTFVDSAIAAGVQR